jgi:hypothetical protein
MALYLPGPLSIQPNPLKNNKKHLRKPPNSRGNSKNVANSTITSRFKMKDLKNNFIPLTSSTHKINPKSPA